MERGHVTLFKQLTHWGGPHWHGALGPPASGRGREDYLLFKRPSLLCFVATAGADSALKKLFILPSKFARLAKEHNKSTQSFFCKY